MATRHRFQVDGQSHTVEIDEQNERITVRIDDGDPLTLDATTSGIPGLFSIIHQGRPKQAYVTREGKNLRVIVEGRVFILGPTGGAGRGRGAAGGLGDPPGIITAPLAGVVVDLRVAVGDAIEPRQTVAVIEAMKMQNEVQAPLAGTVTKVNAVKGARIEKGDVVIEYTPTED